MNSGAQEAGRRHRLVRMKWALVAVLFLHICPIAARAEVDTWDKTYAGSGAIHIDGIDVLLQRVRLTEIEKQGHIHCLGEVVLERPIRQRTGFAAGEFRIAVGRLRARRCRTAESQS